MARGDAYSGGDALGAGTSKNSTLLGGLLVPFFVFLLSYTLSCYAYYGYAQILHGFVVISVFIGVYQYVFKVRDNSPGGGGMLPGFGSGSKGKALMRRASSTAALLEMQEDSKRSSAWSSLLLNLVALVFGVLGGLYNYHTYFIYKEFYDHSASYNNVVPSIDARSV